MFALCIVTTARADTPTATNIPLAEQATPTQAQRAYAVWQFHSQLVPMTLFRYRFEIDDVERKANSGDISMYMRMFFAQYFSTHFRPNDATQQLDVCRAAYWVDRAVKSEDSSSAYWMSQLYLTGNGVPKDTEKAYRYFLFWATTLGIQVADLPLHPINFQISDERAKALQAEMTKWDARKEPALEAKSCPGCEHTNDHLCKLAVSRQKGLEIIEPE